MKYLEFVTRSINGKPEDKNAISPSCIMYVTGSKAPKLLLLLSNGLTEPGEKSAGEEERGRGGERWIFSPFTSLSRERSEDEMRGDK